MYSFIGTNPTKLYYDSLMMTLDQGDECAPRGKLIKELRPAAFEFENPYNRITFLGSRRINPYFQFAEALWILSGRSDVPWLCKFNANMNQFSDDGKNFNAPYGERIRSYGKNNLHNFIVNPVDQLLDAYYKLLNDKDTRQAVIVISHPQFDNSRYTIGEHGKDIACNLVITFKIRHDKLNMTVFNRSNDISWGTFGANLNQFATIQETMKSWLKKSGKEEFSELEVGTYTQFTDSLHVYLDDYGAADVAKVTDYYKSHDPSEVEADYTCQEEPRMSLNAQEFDAFLQIYWNAIDPYLMDDDYISDEENASGLLEMITDFHNSGVIDDYWFFGVKAMLAYRLVKLGFVLRGVQIVEGLVDCQWKISMIYFLKTFVKKVGKDVEKTEEYAKILEYWDSMSESFSESLVHPEYFEQVSKYLEL